MGRTVRPLEVRAGAGVRRTAKRVDQRGTFSERPTELQRKLPVAPK